MRRSAIVITVAVMMLVPEAMAHAQSRASFSACEALSEQRGSGPGPSERTHNAFMRDCLAGKIPFSAGRAFAAAPEAQVQSLERCEALAEQRGAGSAGGSGNRNHRSFIRQCMAGKIR
jgi:hypothetical protein